MNMNTNIIKLSLAKLATVVLVVGASSVAHASSYDVQVGYADDLRPSPFFPNPWQGGTNVDVFAGGQTAGYDAGAVRIINTGATPITFDGMTVDSFGDGASFTIWNAFIGSVILPGHSMILTQTTSYNFDSSDDEGSNPFAIPRVVLDINGSTSNFFDTAQVLNTEGTDHLGANGLNESHAWRDIGTFGGQGAPDTGYTFGLLFLSLIALFGATRFRLA